MARAKPAETAAEADARRAAEAARHIRASLVVPVLEIIGDRWTLLLLAALATGPQRFDGLARRVGIARSTLAQRLADLVRDGLVERRLYRPNPPRHDYALTVRGRDMLPIFHTIRNWDRTWASAEAYEAWPMAEEVERRLVCRSCRLPIHARDVSYAPARRTARGADAAESGARARRRSRRKRESASRAQRLVSAADTVGNLSLALVIAAAFFGLRRFSDMERALGLAPNVLARRLDELVAAGVLARHAYSERPRRWQYILTEKGLDLYPVIVAEIAWADRWLAGRAGTPLALAHKPCGDPLVPVLESPRPRLVAGAAPPERRH